MRKIIRVFGWQAFVVIIAALVIILYGSITFEFQREGIRQYRFKKTIGITIPILPRGDFADRFSADPLVPKTTESILQLARELYVPEERVEIREECGEHPYGLLFVSLMNPDITDATRDEVDNIIDANTPALPKIYTEGHFKFYYTDNDSNAYHNVTLSEIKATAKILNDAWDSYARDFTEPKHYVTGGPCTSSKKMIDVKVYNYYYNGATNSTWNYIVLNSQFTVTDSCVRQTVAPHELFHRVQYSYGYVTLTANMKWATEGTASWAQKYRAPNMGDWMVRMNEGLGIPDISLILDRSYDACHFWVYLGQQGNGEAATIKEVWSNYNTNGNRMKDAVETTIQNRVPNVSSMDQFVGWWAFSNFYKDLSNASPSFDYEEDEWTRSCGLANYGPLDQVPRIERDLNVGSNHSIDGSVSAYGADYYVFNIGAAVKKIEIKSTGTSNNFGYAVAAIKNNTVMYTTPPTGSGKKDFDYTKTISPGQLSHMAFIVIGNPGGGNYTITAKGSS